MQQFFPQLHIFKQKNVKNENLKNLKKISNFMSHLIQHTLFPPTFFAENINGVLML